MIVADAKESGFLYPVSSDMSIFLSKSLISPLSEFHRPPFFIV